MQNDIGPSFNHVTFSVQRSEILGLLGPNGCRNPGPQLKQSFFLELRGRSLLVKTLVT